MEFIGDKTAAPLLSDTKPDKGLEHEILAQYERAVSLGIVHGELSQYNILIQDRPVIIDWPQSVPADYQGADSIKQADIARIESFFISSSFS